MKLRFYTPSYRDAEEFGAATFGFAGFEDETVRHSMLYPEDVSGIALCGTYDECLNNIPSGNFKAGIVLFGNAGNENKFMRKLCEKLQIPFVGGAAAIDPKTGESALLYGHNQVALFLIDDDRFEFTAVCENVHYDNLGEHKISFTDRYIDKIDGVDALSWFNNERKKLGVSENDFEHLTLTDEYGINAHLSVKDGRLFSGRDVNEKMFLRYLPPECAQDRIAKFYDDKDAIIFGCAGLKGTLDHGIKSDGLGLFMFGEVCTTDIGHSDFGNLMLSKLKIAKK